MRLQENYTQNSRMAIIPNHSLTLILIDLVETEVYRREESLIVLIFYLLLKITYLSSSLRFLDN